MNKEQCKICKMLRAKKDLVVLKDNQYLCFSCWNKYMSKKESQE